MEPAAVPGQDLSMQWIVPQDLPSRTRLDGGRRGLGRGTVQRVVVVVFSQADIRPAVSQGLSVMQAAADQGRHRPAISQLGRVWAYGPEQEYSRACQTGAPEQQVCRCVFLFLAHLSQCGVTQCRRALQVAALLAVRGRVTADTVKVAACQAPVPCMELVHIDGDSPIIGEDRLREPVSHDPPEKAVKPAVLPGLGGSRADCLREAADARGYFLLWKAGGILSQLVRIFIAWQPAMGRDPLQASLFSCGRGVQQQVPGVGTQRRPLIHRNDGERGERSLGVRAEDYWYALQGSSQSPHLLQSARIATSSTRVLLHTAPAGIRTSHSSPEG